ncbi:MAG: Crp/Fnr family transcriptional regulator [Alphaproteobacteria bacterium RIFOXYD12_FULL_60_8]|nr:MAG: Crp/Fnr family transcriptional regulator [Alphaproteobacteria bacterium RIFOXYD12_FULL_60_8]
MTEAEGLDKILRAHPFFHDLDEDDIRFLAGCGRNERYEAGEFIFREGAPADRLYLVRHGSVAVEINAPGREPTIIKTLGEGELLGWSWIVEPYTWTYDARALNMTRVLSLNAVCLRNKFDINHELAYRFMRKFTAVMADRLHAAHMQIMDLYGPSKGG